MNYKRLSIEELKKEINELKECSNPKIEKELTIKSKKITKLFKFGVIGFATLFFSSFLIAYFISSILGLVLGITSFLGTLVSGLFNSVGSSNKLKQLLRERKIRKLNKILNKKQSKQKINVKDNNNYIELSNETLLKKDNNITNTKINYKTKKQTKEQNK